MSRSIATITGPVRDMRVASREECNADKAARKERGRPTGLANCPPSARSYLETRIDELRKRYADDPGYAIGGERFTFDAYSPVSANVAPGSEPESLTDAGDFFFGDDDD